MNVWGRVQREERKRDEGADVVLQKYVFMHFPFQIQKKGGLHDVQKKIDKKNKRKDVR